MPARVKTFRKINFGCCAHSVSPMPKWGLKIVYLKGKFMERYISMLAKTKLFSGITEKEITAMMDCLSSFIRGYEKGDCIFQRGSRITSVAMLLEGVVHIQKEDYWGNLSILSEIVEGEIFGEVYACLDGEKMQNNAVAVKPSTVLFLDINRVLTTCPSACDFHSRLIQNLISIMAQKNLMLTRKITHMSQRTTREKLLSYLSEQSMKAGSSVFDIPFNRQQMADYLSVDRSAMSGELCRMRDEGILKFNRNHFELL